MKNRNEKRRLSGVIFDMDGLMFDTERVISHAWDLVGEQMGYGALGAHIRCTLGLNLKGRGEYFRKVCGQDFPFDEFTDRYRKETALYMEKRGVPVKPGLYQLLAWLEERKIPMAVATSASRRYAEEKLRQTNVFSCFKEIICGDQVQFSKPHPQIYRCAVEALGIKPEEAAALEDSPKGLEAALNAGLMAVMIPDLLEEAPGLENRLTAKLRSLEEVPKFLEENFVF